MLAHYPTQFLVGLIALMHPKHNDSKKLVENKYFYKFKASVVVWREQEKVFYLNTRQVDF